MILSVKNFGKIAEARVDIGDYAIFVGNNNSGKTFLMQLIYGVMLEVSNMFLAEYMDEEFLLRFSKEDIVIDEEMLSQIISFANLHLKKIRRRLSAIFLRKIFQSVNCIWS